MSAIIQRRARAMDEWRIPETLHPLLRRIYAGRGVQGAGDLELGLDRLIPIRELKHADAAVELLIAHFRRGTRITVIGDFDADGATSTALMVRQLRRLGFPDVDFLVPNRFEYGYGLTPEIVALAARQKPALIVTVDNGISSHAGVEAARLAGIETLITDHHLPAATLPAAAVIVNPNSPGESFPSKALAGVGVAFYVMAALTRAMQERGLIPAMPVPVSDLLDLVALGTVADLVPLDHNNRILVHQGLRRIRAGRCTPGVRALLEVAGKRIEKIVAADLGFQVGPRLNAAGRLDDMTIGIQCLLTEDPATARLLAGRLAQLNQDRKELETSMQQDAVGSLAEMRMDEASLPLGLCLFAEDWHQGIVGLVASRVKERTHRPVIAFAQADGMLKGSARSVPGVHIRDVLDAIATRHPDLIYRFGGHAMAAGLTLPADRLASFREAFDLEVRRWMTLDDAHGVIHSDGVLEAGDFSLETARVMREAGPWGQAFPEPTFDGRFGVVESRVLGERHLKLKIRAWGESGLTGPICEAIAFRYFDLEGAVGVRPAQQIEIAFRMDVNEYGGTERLQLLIEHLEIVDET